MSVAENFTKASSRSPQAGDDWERWIRRRARLVDRRVGKLVHFHERLGNGGTVVMLEEICILDSVSLSRADGDGGNDGGGVVCRVGVMAGELDGKAWVIWLGDIPMAVAVQVSYESSIIMYPGGPLVGWKAGGVEFLGVRLVVLIGGGVVDQEGIRLGRATDGDADHCF